MIINRIVPTMDNIFKNNSNKGVSRHGRSRRTCVVMKIIFYGHVYIIILCIRSESRDHTTLEQDRENGYYYFCEIEN